MNRSKIEWTDFSWNPVTGCLNACWYCYAKRLTLRFPKNFPQGFDPAFHPGRLIEPWERKKPAKIFVCSIADLFASWTPKRWRDRVISYAWMCPTPHTFQFLTKNPELIPLKPGVDYPEIPLKSGVPYPDNFWMGTTVTCEDVKEDHLIWHDWKNIEEIKKVQAGVRFVSFEPLLGALPGSVSLEGLDWIIIGKLTGSKKVKLDPDWVDEILTQALQLGIPVFMKNNLKPDYPGKLIQEFPK